MDCYILDDNACDTEYFVVYILIVNTLFVYLRKNYYMPRKTPKYIDLFAGCGGLSLGLHKAGWKGLFAIEKSKDAFETLEYNLITKKEHLYLTRSYLRIFYGLLPKRNTSLVNPHTAHAADQYPGIDEGGLMLHSKSRQNS